MASHALLATRKPKLIGMAAWRTAIATGMVSILVGTASAAPAIAYPRPSDTELVSVASDGSQGRCRQPTDRVCLVWNSSVSDTGRYVAFQSGQSNLVPRDLNLVPDIFVRDRKKNKTELASVTSLGVQAIGVLFGSLQPSISADGRFVAFESEAVNLVNDDTNLAWDIFVRDRKTGSTERVSVASDGSQALHPVTSHDSNEASISADGRYVAFAEQRI